MTDEVLFGIAAPAPKPTKGPQIAEWSISRMEAQPLDVGSVIVLDPGGTVTFTRKRVTIDFEEPLLGYLDRVVLEYSPVGDSGELTASVVAIEFTPGWSDGPRTISVSESFLILYFEEERTASMGFAAYLYSKSASEPGQTM